MTVATKPKIQRTRREAVDSSAVQPIVERLQSVLRRIRRIIVLRGLLGVVAIALAATLLLMGVDALVVIESTLLRSLISLTGCTAVALAVWWFVVRPLRRRLNLTTVARMIELHHPELQERVSSAFELLSAPQDGRGSRGSEQLIAALAAEASLDVRSFDPKREVGTRSLRPYAIAAGVLASVFLLVITLWPSQSANILARLVRPGSNLDRVQALSLEVTPNEDRIVALGAPLTICVRASDGRLTHPLLRHVDSTGHEARHEMEPVAASDGSEAFAYRYEGVLESFEFRIQDGPALTRTYRITAVERPRIEQVRVEYEYPSYTALPGAVQTDATRPVTAPLRTKLRITAVCDRTIVKPMMRLGDVDLDGEVDAAAQAPSYSWSVAMDNHASSATLLVEDSHGIQSEPTVIQLRVLPDRPPQVVITDPMSDAITLKPTERLTLQYRVDEDFGLSAAALLVSIDGAPAVDVALTLPRTETPSTAAFAPDGRFWKETALLDLSKFDLATAKNVSVQIRVSDNRPAPAGPQVAVSLPLRITLDQAAPSYPKVKAIAQVDAFEKEVQKVLKDVTAVQPVVQKLAANIPDAGKPTEQTLAEIENVRTTANEAAADLINIAARYDDTLLKPFTPALTEVARQPLAQAQQDAGQVQTADNPNDRRQAAKGTAAEIGKAVAQLENILSKLPQHRADLSDLATLEDIRSKQEKVVADIEQEVEQPSTPDATQPWRKDETGVANELKDLAGKEPSAKDGMPSDGEKGDGEKGNGQKPGGKEGMSSQPSDKEGDGKGDGMSPGKGKPGAPKPPKPGALASAASKASQAAGAPSASQAQPSAISALQSISQGASAKAQGMGIPSISSAPAPGQGGPSGQSPPGLTGARSAGSAGAAVKQPDVRLHYGTGDWIVWRGSIKGNATQGTSAETPPGYSDIVGKYFAALSKHGVTSRGDDSRPK